MLAESPVACPYCGETITLLVDCSAGDQSYVEDCSVCCQPIVLDIRVDGQGEITAIQARAENP